MNAICLVVDGLHAGYLGPYGNSWIETPNLNHLAAESLVCDAAYVDSPELESLYRCFWSGQHALDKGNGALNLTDRLRDAGVMSTLVSDAPDVIADGTVAGFDDVLRVTSESRTKPATEIGRTAMAELFAGAVNWLGGHDAPYCLWMHSRGMNAPWDGPVRLRNAFVDEDEEDPPATVEPVSRRLASGYDPDEVLAVRRMYAGQVQVFDACLGGLLEAIDRYDPGDETLLVVTSAGGYPLGEHGAVGAVDDAPYGERVQIPLFLRLPGGRSRGRRSPALVQTTDIWPTLLDWWRMELPQGTRGTSLLPLVDDAAADTRDRLVIKGASGQRAMRTHRWYLVEPRGKDNDAPGELYAKPDDRWEQNNVAELCGGIVDEMQRALDAWCEGGPGAELEPIDEEVGGRAGH